MALEMKQVAKERRRWERNTSAWPVVLKSLSGTVITHGRTANVSQAGAFVITSGECSIQIGDTLIAEMSLPSVDSSGGARPMRTICYSCRVVRTSRLGQLFGIGIELDQRMSLAS